MIHHVVLFIYEFEQIDHDVSGHWVRLTKRRLKTFGGVPHPDGMIEERLPDWIQQVCKSVVSLL